jgi:hypothetical protein
MTLLPSLPGERRKAPSSRLKTRQSTEQRQSKRRMDARVEPAHEGM